MESLLPPNNERKPEGPLFGFTNSVAYNVAVLATTQLKTRTPDTTGRHFDKSVLSKPIVPSFAPDVPDES